MALLDETTDQTNATETSTQPAAEPAAQTESATPEQAAQPDVPQQSSPAPTRTEKELTMDDFASALETFTTETETVDEEGTELYQCCIHPWMRAGAPYTRA